MKNYQLNNIILHTLNASSRTGVLSFASRQVPCCLGSAGIVSRKHESDGGTPRGILPLLRVYYRPDRVKRPKTQLPVYPLANTHGWCDEPRDPNYNQLVTWPYAASAEHLWRQDHIYDIIVVLGYNLRPCKKSAGSAVFWHLARDDFSPTAGCLAINKAEMIKMLELCGPKTRLLTGVHQK